MDFCVFILIEFRVDKVQKYKIFENSIFHIVKYFIKIVVFSQLSFF